MSEFRESLKIKVVQLHEGTPKKLLNSTMTPQTSPLGPQRDKNYPEIKQNSNVKIQGIIEMNVV